MAIYFLILYSVKQVQKRSFEFWDRIPVVMGFEHSFYWTGKSTLPEIENASYLFGHYETIPLTNLRALIVHLLTLSMIWE